MVGLRNKKSRKCGDFPWRNTWHVRMNSKKPRYFCINCRHLFYTGKFWRNDDDMYDDVCPRCGGYPCLTFEELAEEFVNLLEEYEQHEDEDKEE